ncbi:hypothetical protein [Azospirillum sp. TSO22-1]|uniref:hypothetical protein n=1 Tax=Azospirillum sp. TSO22-1 TaxID=716789 RepID=UPI000D647EA9|nr:hypothetical protein [Azospirillum sp. TSO22-1]
MDEAPIGTAERAHPVDADALDVRPEVRAALADAAFTPLDTGDGCLAWCRASDDDTHVMISANNDLDGDPQAPDWILGCYGDSGGFVEVSGLTLEAAIEGAALLRAPLRADGSLVEAIYPTLEQALDDLA